MGGLCFTWQPCNRLPFELLLGAHVGWIAKQQCYQRDVSDSAVAHANREGTKFGPFPNNNLTICLSSFLPSRDKKSLLVHYI